MGKLKFMFYFDLINIKGMAIKTDIKSNYLTENQAKITSWTHFIADYFDLNLFFTIKEVHIK